MPEYKYDHVEHIYKVDGVVWPSVTQLLHPLNDFSKIPPAVLERKRIFGSQLHKIIELEALCILDESSLSDFQRLYLFQLRKWQADHNISIQNAIGEKQLWCNRFKFAGTPDLIFPGKLLVEAKSRKMSKLTDGLQLAGQEILVNENFAPAAKYEQRVLSLRDNAYDYLIVDNLAQQRENKNRFIWMVKQWWKNGGGYDAETITKIQKWKV